MAYENVEFSRGQSSSIPSNKVPGRFLIETDTGAMYLDDSSFARIQIKDTTKIQGINSQSISIEDQGSGIRNIEVKVNEYDSNNALVSSSNGLSVSEVKVSQLQPSYSEKAKLWVDTSSSDPGTATVDADELNGQTGDFYLDLNNQQGTLPLNKGGTGVTSLSALKSLLGIRNITQGTSAPAGGSSGDIYFQYK